jgi:hypothetical protein
MLSTDLGLFDNAKVYVAAIASSLVQTTINMFKER